MFTKMYKAHDGTVFYSVDDVVQYEVRSLGRDAIRLYDELEEEVDGFCYAAYCLVKGKDAYSLIERYAEEKNIDLAVYDAGFDGIFNLTCNYGCFLFLGAEDMAAEEFTSDIELAIGEEGWFTKS